MESYRDANTRYHCFTKEDNHRLQVLQNQVSRLLVKKPCEKNTSTKDLLNLSGDLSIHQIGALRTLNLVKKVLLTKKPNYLAERLKPKIGRERFGIMLTQPYSSLGSVREGFIFRGISLFNRLPNELKKESDLSKFKSVARKWIKENVAVKP